MANRRQLLRNGGALALLAGMRAAGATSPHPGGTDTAQPNAQRSTRELWLDWVERVSAPVLEALGKRELRRLMPVEAVAGHEAERAIGTHLEALGRLLMGLAPWLELDPQPGESARETALRTRFRKLAQLAVASAVDPASPDYMRFGASNQTVVDASFLALGILRAPRQLIDTLSAQTRQQLVAALIVERRILTGLNNWVLFAAMDEALLSHLGADWDRMRVAYALNELQAWYLGDGTYGDCPHFHADFYNSYVMQPYLLMLMQQVGSEAEAWKKMRPAIEQRATRYAAIQERVIGPDGTFPALGRSICYRAGAFHLLADAALRGLLPESASPAAVRGALTAAQQRTLGAAGTFDEHGWLRIGLGGHQPSLAETYISTGSLYLCSAAWLPLGLPASHAFWSDPDRDWTQKKVWSGQDVAADHAADA